MQDVTGKGKDSEKGPAVEHILPSVKVRPKIWSCPSGFFSWFYISTFLNKRQDAIMWNTEKSKEKKLDRNISGTQRCKNVQWDGFQNLSLDQ